LSALKGAFLFALKGGETVADSVGKIQLDLEITPSSISRELGAVNKAFSSGLQGMFGNIKNFAKTTIGDIAGQIRKAAGVKDEILPDPEAEEMSAKFGGSIKRMEEKMASLRSGVDKTNSKIAELRTSMADLLAEQDAIARGYAEMPPIGGLTKDQSMEKLLASDTRYGKLSAEIEALELRIQSLGNRNKQAAGEMGVLGRAIDRVKEAASQASGSTERLEKSSSRAGKAAQKTSGHISRVGDSARGATGKIAGYAIGMQRAFTRVLKQIFVFALLYKAIRGMTEYVGSALQTNQAFSNSLAQVKTNLQVAFMPIYQAILPALNSLMAWLAKATAYIASFVSALFGKTYKQSFQAAQAMSTAQKNLSDTGKAAKKSLESTAKAARKATKEAQGALLAFDEIHVLNLDKGDEGDTGDEGAGGGADEPGLVAPSMDMGAVDSQMQTLADKVKSVFATLFQPFKAAWENEGAATIAAAKYALDGIWALIKEIGKSFAEVWTNGSGQAVLEVILRILQQIFGLIGDIGYTFANAWAEGGRGTAIVQGLANVFLHLLGLVERIGISLRSVWGEVGATVARVFLDIIGATVGVLENLAEKLLWVWDHGGQHLFESLIKLGAKIFELAGYIYTEFVVPFVNGFVNMMAPAVAVVLDGLGWLLDKFTALIDWLLGDGKPVLNTIVTVLGSLALAFSTVKLATIAYQGVLTVLNGVMKAVQLASSIMQKGLLASLGPFNLAVLAIGALIAIGILLYKNWDEISAWLKKTWDGIKTAAVEIFDAIKDAITGAFDSAKTTVLSIWDTITTAVVKIWGDIKTTASTIFNAVRDAVVGAFNSVYTGVTGVFGRLETFISGVCNSIAGFFRSMVNAVIRGLNAMIRGLNRLKVNIPDWVPGLGGKSLGFNIPQIPQLAKGGIVEQPTLAMIGEKRKKEAVVPLEQNTEWMDKLIARFVAAMQAVQATAGSGEEGPWIFQFILNGKIAYEAVIDEAKRRNARAGKTIAIPVG